MFKMAERSDGCSGETLLAPCIKKKRLQRQMTKTATGQVFKKILACLVFKKILPCLVSRRVIVIA